MRLFVYEHLTALGLGRDPAHPLHPMYCEGKAMRDAVAADFRRVPGIDVSTTRDEGEPYDEERFLSELEQSDRQLVIAPESDDILLRLSLLAQPKGKLLNCTPDAIRLTGDKLALATHWREHGVQTPATTDREPTACEALPVVWKPRHGAGSTATYLLKDGFDLARAKAALAGGERTGPMVLQEFVSGRAASIAFLCGPTGYVPLVPAFQRLSNDGRFHYLGGELPIPSHLAERAVRLGTQAVQCVPGLKGYVGVDLVLHDSDGDGSRDYAIEMNPRLTTSYLGLRALAEFNLAEALLRAATGTNPGELRWKSRLFRFTAEGSTV